MTASNPGLLAWFCFATGLFGQSLFGMFVSERILSLGNRKTPSFVELCGLGCVLGVGITAWVLFILSFCGVPLGFPLSGLLTVIGFLTGGPILIKQRRKSEILATFNENAARRQEFAVCRAFQSLIGILFLLCLLQTLQTPQKLWDERAIFALKARVLFEDRTIDSAALRHHDFVQYHPRYPLLLPLAEQHIYALLGSAEDRWSKVVFSLLYIGMVITTAGVLAGHYSRSRAWLGALLIATVPVLMPDEYGFLCGQADAPVACFHTVSVLYLWDGLKRLKRGEGWQGSLCLAGISAGLTVFTKDEGIAYFMLDASILGLFAVCALFTWDQCRAWFFAAILFVASVAVIIVPWFAHRRHLPLTTEMNYFGRMTVTLFLSRLDTLNWSIPHLLRRMFWEWREWGLQWWLMLAAFVARPARAIQQPQLLFVLDVLGSLVSLLIAGMLAPAQLDEHLGGSSHRFLMQIAPVAILFAVTMFPDSENDTRQSTSSG